MGDRANVVVKSKADGAIFFYTHWAGSGLPEIIAEGLGLAISRWQDPSYLRRILFCHLVKGFEGETTGFGISGTIGDSSHPILVIDVDKQVVGLANESAPKRIIGKGIPFAMFVVNPGVLPWS